MRRGGRDTGPGGRKRGGRERRGREHGLGTRHRTVLCPGCRSHIPYLEGLQDPPETCGGCGYRFRCGNCGGDIRRDENRPTYVDEEGVERFVEDPADCPRCGRPADGTDPAMTPEEESFTWEDE